MLGLLSWAGVRCRPSGVGMPALPACLREYEPDPHVRQQRHLPWLAAVPAPGGWASADDLGRGVAAVPGRHRLTSARRDYSVWGSDPSCCPAAGGSAPGSVERKVGGLRIRLACSNANARAISVGSLHRPPNNETPSGRTPRAY